MFSALSCVYVVSWLPVLFWYLTFFSFQVTCPFPLCLPLVWLSALPWLFPPVSHYLVCVYNLFPFILCHFVLSCEEREPMPAFTTFLVKSGFVFFWHFAFFFAIVLLYVILILCSHCSFPQEWFFFCWYFFIKRLLICTLSPSRAFGSKFSCDSNVMSSWWEAGERATWEGPNL